MIHSDALGLEPDVGVRFGLEAKEGRERKGQRDHGVGDGGFPVMMSQHSSVEGYVGFFFLEG